MNQYYPPTYTYPWSTNIQITPIDPNSYNPSDWNINVIKTKVKNVPSKKRPGKQIANDYNAKRAEKRTLS